MGNKVSGAFPYEVEEHPVLRLKTGWSLHSGWRTQDRKSVSVFLYSLSPGESIESSSALNFLQRLKTLRHPYVLPYIAGVTIEQKRQVRTTISRCTHI